MKAIEISQAGGPEVLTLTDRPMPEPDYDQVVIKVAYAGVNRPDALQRAGLYNPPEGASDLPGLEAAGEVVACGAGVSAVKPGDQVCALLPGGGYAEYVATPAAHCLPIPGGMTLKQAACLPETFFTVWANVFMRGGLQAGQRFLVHGGSSGIGTTAIQLAKAFGARVFATAGSAEKCAACVSLGADAAFNYRDIDFVEEMRDQLCRYDIPVRPDISSHVYARTYARTYVCLSVLSCCQTVKSVAVGVSCLSVAERSGAFLV